MLTCSTFDVPGIEESAATTKSRIIDVAQNNRATADRVADTEIGGVRKVTGGTGGVSQTKRYRSHEPRVLSVAMTP